MAPMACSRTPKRRLRSAYEFFWKSPYIFMSVMLEGARSADPPRKPGMAGAERVEHGLRVQARRQALVLGVKDGSAVSQPGGQLAGEHRRELGALGRVLLDVVGEGGLPLGLGGLAAGGGLGEDVVGGLGDLRKGKGG